MTRKEGGRGLTSIEDSADTSIRRRKDYIKRTKKDLLQQPKTTQVTEGSTEITPTRKQKWEEKQLYGYFKRQTREISK